MKEISNKEVYIYGSGEIGIILKEILENNNIETKGFLVSKGYKTCDKVDHTCVYEYDVEENRVIDFSISNSVVFMTTNNNAKEILNSLKIAAGTVYDYSSKEKFLEIYKTQYIPVLKRYGKYTDDQKRIEFPCFSILNPEISDMGYQLSLYLEFADLIYPYLDPSYDRYTEGPYELNHVMLDKEDVVFDCGSNIGLFTAYAASKGCHVHAFEPVENIVSYIEFMKSQFEDKITIAEYALSDQKGETYFEMSEEVGTVAKMIDHVESSSRLQKVKMTTIDDYVRENHVERVDFIKADIEGAERYMLMGAKETIAKFSPKLSICTYHLPDDEEVLTNIIKDINPNYKFEYKYKKLYAYVPN